MTPSPQTRICRPATPADLPDLAKLHQAAFKQFFMTSLGPGFLATYYAFAMAQPGSILLVTVGPEGIDGFVSGSTDPRRFYTEMRRQRWRFALAAGLVVIRNPFLIRRLLASASQVNNNTAWEDGVSELASIAVHPDHGGQGIGKCLLLEFIRTARTRACGIELTTDAEDNDPVKRFYERHGFRAIEIIERSTGRKMTRYYLDLNGAIPPKQPAGS